MANRDIRQIYDKQWTVTVVDEVLGPFFLRKKILSEIEVVPPFKLLAVVTLLIDTVYTLFTIQTVLHCLNIGIYAYIY